MYVITISYTADGYVTSEWTVDKEPAPRRYHAESNETVRCITVDGEFVWEVTA